MSRKHEELGKLGERIIYDLLRRNGVEVFMSEDKYDSEKDMYLADGRKIEVKTEPAYKTENKVSFRKDQLRKCTSCDILFFVTTPMTDYPNYKNAGAIFVCRDPKSLKYHEYQKPFYGKMTDMIGVYFKDLEFLEKITDEKDLQALTENRSFTGKT